MLLLIIISDHNKEIYNKGIRDIAINFDTYKPLLNHAGITNENTLPPNFGSLHHQYLGRFKYAPPLADMEPQYDIPYEFEKRPTHNKQHVIMNS